MVILTWNEERNIDRCLASLAAQTELAFETIVIDAGSADRTLAIVEAARSRVPYTIRVEAIPYRMPIGEARNLGVALARTDRVAFLSADAEADPHWVHRAVDGLRDADMVFGRQLHRPTRWTVGAAVRGLRYHFPADRVVDAAPYASNVSAAYRKEVLKAWPFDPDTNAAEDLLLARRAIRAGRLARYDPYLIVEHHDVAGVREEFVKNVREGMGCGRYADELGLMAPLLAWGGALVLAGLALVLWPGLASVLLVCGVVWAPAIRRAVRRRHAMGAIRILVGSAVSPFFDLVFLIQYLRGLTVRRLVDRPARSKEPIP